MRYLLFVLPFALLACKDDCEKATDRINAKLEECGVETSTDGDSEGEEVECTDELATQLECNADCYEAADCSAMDGSDPTGEAAMDLANCLMDCMSGGGTETAAE